MARYEANKSLIPLCRKQLLRIGEYLSEGSEEVMRMLFRMVIPKPSSYQSQKETPQKNQAVYLMLPIGVSAGENLPDIQNLNFHVLSLCWLLDSPLDRSVDKFISGALLRKIFSQTPNAPFVSSDWWRCYTGHSMHRMSENYLIMSYNGDIVRGKSSNVPPKYERSGFCRGLFQTLVIPAVSDCLLVQSLNSEEEHYLGGSYQQPPPLHIGWKQNNGFFDYYGIFSPKTESVKYGNLFLARDNDVKFRAEWELPFSAIAPAISIPLFAYDVFSIIKPFIPDYPDRISVQERFSVVKRKQERIIFIALSGEARREIANAYCGMFTEYPETDNLNLEFPDVVRKLYSARVHDGVVILPHTYRNANKFQDSDLLRDACCLCLEAEFDQTDNEILLEATSALDSKTLGNIKYCIADMLKGFVGYFRKMYESLQINACKSCFQEIYSDFQRSFAQSCHSVGFNARDELDSEALKNLSRVSYKRWIDLKKVVQILHGEYLGFYQRAREEGSPVIKHYALIEKQANDFKKRSNLRIKEAKKRFSLDLMQFDQIKKEFGDFAESERKYYYLYIGIRLFCDYLLSEGQKEFAISLKSQSLRILRRMDTSKTTPVQSLADFLSAKIESHEIICVRTAQNDPISGWYDGKKGMIYLPFPTYFDDLVSFYVTRYQRPFPFERHSFQKELLDDGILAVNNSQKKGNYTRYDSQIVVTPAGEGTQSKRAVLKISVKQLPLSTSAQERLEYLAQIPVARRSKSIIQ